MHKAILFRIVLRVPQEIKGHARDQFFLPGIKAGLRTATPPLAADQARLEILRFFVNSHLEQAFAIVDVSRERSRKEAFKVAREAVRPFAEDSLDDYDPRYIAWGTDGTNGSADSLADVSTFLRDNTTLEASRYRSCNGKQCAADAEGFGVISGWLPPIEHFERVTRVYALAVAYSEALSIVSQEASSVAKASPELAEKTMRSLTQFMVAHYFDHPISTRTRELLEFYAIARDQLRLVDQSRETTSQLHLLAQIVREDRRDVEVAARQAEIDARRQADVERREQMRAAREQQAQWEKRLKEQQEQLAKRENAFQRKIGILGLIIAAFGLFPTMFSIVQITPASLHTFVEAWSSPSSSSDPVGEATPVPTQPSPPTKTTRGKRSDAPSSKTRPVPLRSQITKPSPGSY